MQKIKNKMFIKFIEFVSKPPNREKVICSFPPFETKQCKFDKLTVLSHGALRVDDAFSTSEHNIHAVWNSRLNFEQNLNAPALYIRFFLVSTIF